jgi:hypothetical protein
MKHEPPPPPLRVHTHPNPGFWRMVAIAGLVLLGIYGGVYLGVMLLIWG